MSNVLTNPAGKPAWARCLTLGGIVGFKFSPSALPIPARSSPRMVLRHRFVRLRGPQGLATLLVPAALALLRPSGAAAQAIGTMQVTARVHEASAAWAAVAATGDLAGRNAGSAPAPSRLDLGLVRLQLEDPAPEPRRLRIRIDYLRN